MKWFLGTYTSRFNRQHKLSGHLFSGRYKALIVDGSGRGYLRTVCDCVQVLEWMSGGVGEHHGGEARRETEEQKAQRLVRAELARRGWTDYSAHGN